METTIEKFDRANNQGKNHDIKGNITNVDNETLKPETDDKQLEVPTVTPDNDNEELENPQPQNSSNKGQGPAGENL
jgi:ribosome maturation factor RimP